MEETSLNNCFSRSTAATTTGHGSKKTWKTPDTINLSFLDNDSNDQVDLSGSCSSPWLSRPLDLSWNTNPREEEQQFKRDITKHNVAERCRREKLNQKFIALSATIPGLKKADKASILRDAVRYMKQLEAKTKLLEEQIKERMAEYVVRVKKYHIGADDVDVDVDEESEGSPPRPWQLQAFPEIEVEVSGKTVLISVHCENRKGVVVKILSEIEGLNLAITNANVMPFLVSSITVTVTAQVEEEFSEEAVKDVVAGKLKSALA